MAAGIRNNRAMLEKASSEPSSAEVTKMLLVVLKTALLMLLYTWLSGRAFSTRSWKAATGPAVCLAASLAAGAGTLLLFILFPPALAPPTEAETVPHPLEMLILPFSAVTAAGTGVLLAKPLRLPPRKSLMAGGAAALVLIL